VVSEEHSQLVHRQTYMVKTWTKLYLLVVLFIIALGGVLYFYFLKYSLKPETQIFPATVDRDCAPWDGSAFTVTVQYDAMTEIYISIWKTPDIRFPSMYALPDDKGQVGYAYILPELDPFIVLSGDVYLQSVSVDKPIEGRFNLKSEGGERFEGRFIAKWGDKVMLCG